MLPNPGEICRHLAGALQVLLLHVKTSRETFAIGINLLRKRVLEKFSIIYPF
jgi:hypothetical protein